MKDEDREATPLEAKADKVVQAIIAKGPELTRAIHERLSTEVTLIAGTWELWVGTSTNDYRWRRVGYKAKEVARIKPYKRRWAFETNGESPKVKGKADDIEEAFRECDEALRLAGYKLVPGRATAGPWTRDEDKPGTWVRRVHNGLPKADLVRVTGSNRRGSNWFWMMTKMAGPGPTYDVGPWATREAAMHEADTALEATGWIVPSP